MIVDDHHEKINVEWKPQDQLIAIKFHDSL